MHFGWLMRHSFRIHTLHYVIFEESLLHFKGEVQWLRFQVHPRTQFDRLPKYYPQHWGRLRKHGLRHHQSVPWMRKADGPWKVQMHGHDRHPCLPEQCPCAGGHSHWQKCGAVGPMQLGSHGEIQTGPQRHVPYLLRAPQGRKRFKNCNFLIYFSGLFREL